MDEETPFPVSSPPRSLIIVGYCKRVTLNLGKVAGMNEI